MELLIVVRLGILSAVALPNFPIKQNEPEERSRHSSQSSGHLRFTNRHRRRATYTLPEELPVTGILTTACADGQHSRQPDGITAQAQATVNGTGVHYPNSITKIKDNE